MIKLSTMVRERPNASLESLIERAYKLGLDTVDIHVGGLPRDAGYLQRIKLLCLKHGLPIGYLGSGGGFVGMPDDVRRQIEQAKADVDAAVLLGAPLVRLMGGRVLDTTENAEAVRAGIVESFQEVADYAAPKGVVLGVQNHPPPAAPTGEDIIRIIQEADRENVSHIMDTGQWWGSIGADPRGQFDPDVNIYEYMEQTAPYASCVRAKIYKIDLGREEWIDYERVMGILRGVGYNGSMCICFEGQGNKYGEDECMRLAVSHLREVIAST